MKDYKWKITAAVCLMVAFFAVLGIAGDCDYADQVILRMSYEEYGWVKDTLTKQKHGRTPSEREIAHWWVERHNEYR